MSLRRLAFAAILLPGLALILAGCGQGTVAKETPRERSVENAVRLTVKFGDLRDSIQLESAWNESTTVLDLLLAAVQNSGEEVDYDGKGQSAFVRGIAGIKGGSALGWWIYRVNGKLVNQGSGVKRLRPGDHVLWQLGEYN